MARRMFHGTLALAGVAALLAGCVTAQGVAKSMYAAQYNCPEEKVDYENLAGYRAIMVRGCGYQQLYACNPQGGACVRDGERTAIGGGVAPAATSK